MNLLRKPAIWADALQLAAEMELTVRAFPRSRQSTLGRELHRQAVRLCRLVAQAVGFPVGWRVICNERVALRPGLFGCGDLARTQGGGPFLDQTRRRAAEAGQPGAVAMTLGVPPQSRSPHLLIQYPGGLA